MEKNYFIFLFCLIFAISYSQHSDQDSNLKSLRKLENGEETILIGFDNYTYDLINSNQDLNLTFNTYILLKNWNLSRIKPLINLNNITINSSITYINETEFTNNGKFECSYDDKIIYYEPFYSYRQCYDGQPYCIIKYICQSISNGTFFPKKINLVTDFLNNNSVKINDTSISYESTSSQALKRDITKLNYEIEEFAILENSNFISKSLDSFKIKGRPTYFDSNNIELITMVNGYPKKIPCKGYKEQYNEDDNTYFFLETNGKYNLPNTDLKYTIANYTKRNRMLLLDFKEGENTAFIEKKNVPSRSNGLSTGGIIAIIIPTCLVLLGVTALAFYLSRKPTPPSPIKNIGNNTIGVASTEAIIHQ